MVIALWVIAILILVSVVSLIKFMRDMAGVEDELIKEIREVKGVLQKIYEKQL
jgi:hypothetical protein